MPRTFLPSHSPLNMTEANKEEGRKGEEGGVAPHPTSGVGISRLHPNGVTKRGYRTIEYILRSSDCVDNRHLRRLTGGGTHGGRRELYENAFSSYEESSDEETKGECLPMESWAENFMRLLLYDERGSHIAKKGKKLKKDLVDSLSIVERVEEILQQKIADGKVVDDDVYETGKNILFFDMCSGKGITGLMLGYRFPNCRVIGVDIRPPNPSEVHLKEGAFENVQRLTGDVYDDEAMDKIVQQTPKGGESILLGTHLCGDLSRVAVDMIARYPDKISSAIIAPCCLMKQKKPSRYLTLGKHSLWGIDTAQIARDRGIDPIGFWLERLKDRAPVPDEYKGFVCDEDMLSNKNTFIVIRRPPEWNQEGPVLCQEIDKLRI